MGVPLHRLTAVFFALWGLFSFGLGMTFLMMSLFGPADIFESSGIPADTSPHARALMMQNNVSLAAGGIVVLVAAIKLAWNSPTRGYWIMLGVSGLFTFETVAFEVIPGHLGLAEVGAHLVVWLAATTLGATAYWRARTEAAAPPRAETA